MYEPSFDEIESVYSRFSRAGAYCETPAVYRAYSPRAVVAGKCVRLAGIGHGIYYRKYPHGRFLKTREYELFLSVLRIGEDLIVEYAEIPAR